MKKYVCFFTGEFINPSNTKKTKQKKPPQKHALSYRSHMTCLCKFCYNYLVYYSYMNSLGETPKDMFFVFILCYLMFLFILLKIRTQIYWSSNSS